MMPKESVFKAKDETLLNILPHYWEIQSVLNLGQTSKKYHALAVSVGPLSSPFTLPRLISIMVGC